MVRTKAGPTKGPAKPIASKSAKLNLIKHEKKIEKPHGNSIVKRRAKNGSKALREIRFLQKSTHLLIAKAPFIRVVREIIQTISGQPDYRITEAAVEALREASEANMTSFFEDANLLCIHAKRVTLFPQDIRLLRALRVNSDPSVVPL